MNWKTTKHDETSLNKIWSEHVSPPPASHCSAIVGAGYRTSAHSVASHSRAWLPQLVLTARCYDCPRSRGLIPARLPQHTDAPCCCYAPLGGEGDGFRGQVAENQVYAEPVPVDPDEQRPWLTRCAPPTPGCTRPWQRSRPACSATHACRSSSRAAAFVTDKIGYRVGLDPIDLGDEADVKEVVQQIIDVNRRPQEKCAAPPPPNPTHTPGSPSQESRL